MKAKEFGMPIVLVLQKPLDFELNPKYGDNSGGRFIALYDGWRYGPYWYY